MRTTATPSRARPCSHHTCSHFTLYPSWMHTYCIDHDRHAGHCYGRAPGSSAAFSFHKQAVKAMRNIKQVAFLLLSLALIIVDRLLPHVDAFSPAASSSATKKRSFLNRHRHVMGVSHFSEDFDLTKDTCATPEHSLLSTLSSASSTSTLSPIQAMFTKYAMISYISHLCIALPMVLFPTYLKNKVMMTLGLQTKAASEHEALQVSQMCASTLLKLIPFVNVQISSPHMNDQDGEEEDPVPTIWVSNHVSNLDTFIFLSSDEQIRGKNRRPIKTIYVSAYLDLA